MSLKAFAYLLAMLLLAPNSPLIRVSCGTSSQPSLRSNIESFKVMDVLARAAELEHEGRHICHMEVGQPSTGAPSKVVEVAKEFLGGNILGYTNALGIVSLRNAIASHYKKIYGVEVPADRIVVTTGSSAAFVLAFMGCFDDGDCIAICSSGYPCYRNIMKATGLKSINVPVNEEYKITAKELAECIDERRITGLPPLKGLILSSPSNPTGAMLTPDELHDLCKLCDQNGIVFLSDEIYHGITYSGKSANTALEYSNSPIVINSFSKYFSMTGWRLGWMVVPDELIDTMNRLSQNLYINAPTLSQFAACKAFDCTDELDGHVAKYTVNREIVLSTLKELGIDKKASPADGAFYIYVDLYDFGVTDAPALCSRILEEAGMAITPGTDFECPSTEYGMHRVRFSYSRSTEEVREGMNRFKKWWIENMTSMTQKQGEQDHSQGQGHEEDQQEEQKSGEAVSASLEK